VHEESVPRVDTVADKLFWEVGGMPPFPLNAYRSRSLHTLYMTSQLARYHTALSTLATYPFATPAVRYCFTCGKIDAKAVLEFLRRA